jgi:DUF3102 family protein
VTLCLPLHDQLAAQELAVTEDGKKLEAKRAAIAKEIFELIECRRASRRLNNIQLGRKFTESKDTFTEHGQWIRYYKENFESRTGISLNSAQRYMRLAREADQKMQNAFFEPATDSEAKEIEAAAQAAKKEVDRELQLILRLNLRLTSVEDKEVLLRFCTSPKWSFVEKKLIKLLKRLYEESKNEDLDSAA